MKVRTGFVSNSSSSSFCILGVESPNSEKCLWDGTIKTFLEENYGISDYSEDSCFVGIPATALPEDKTLKEMKQIVADEVNRVFEIDAVKPEHIKWFIDGGYDG